MLTCTHCVRTNTRQPYKHKGTTLTKTTVLDRVTVKVGHVNRKATVRLPVQEKVSKTWYQYDDYDYDNFNTRGKFDIGVILLPSQLDFSTKFVSPAVLPADNHREIGRNCRVVGLGKTEYEDEISRYLLWGETHHLSFDQCHPQHYQTITEKNNICLGTRTEEQMSMACHGDSGGPIVCEGEENKNFVIGIVAGCTKNADYNMLLLK